MTMDSTIVNVADRLIDLGERGIMALADKIETVAPQVWEIAARQVWAEAITDLFVHLLALGISYGVYRFFARKYNYVRSTSIACDDDDDENNDGYYYGSKIFGIITVVCAFLSIVAMRGMILVCINPAYYTALKALEMAGLR